MKHQSIQQRRLRDQVVGFTLVEMLTVVSILLVLITLAATSIRGINGSTNRHAAVGTLMGVFEQARMTAVSDGRATYVVFASNPGAVNGGALTTALPASMWGQTYALFEDPVLVDASTAATFIPVQRSAWLYLPTGVAFRATSVDSTDASLTATLPVTAGDGTKFNVQSRSAIATVALALPYVKFDPMGQIVDYKGNVLDAGSSVLRVLLFEGLTSSSGVETYTHQSAINTSATADMSKQFAFDEILLKPTTGRAEYTLDANNNLAAATQ